MGTESFKIKNKKGFKLAALIDFPESKVIKYYAVFAHCFTCTKDLKAIKHIADGLSEYGVAMLRFDMTGIGDSEGDFSDTNFTTQIEDLESIYDFMIKEFDAPKLMIGHSLGGCAVIYASRFLDKVKAVCTIASPSEPASISLKLRETREKAFINKVAETEIGGVKYKFKPQFFEDVESYDFKAVMQSFRLPYLILHSPMDNYTDIMNSAMLFSLAKHPKSFVSLDNADHLLLNPEDARYAGRVIAVWASRYTTD